MDIGGDLCGDHFQGDAFVEAVVEETLLGYQRRQNFPDDRGICRRCDLSQFVEFVLADLQELPRVSAESRQHEISDVFQKILEDSFQISSRFCQGADDTQDFWQVILDESHGHLPQFCARCQTEDADDIAFADGLGFRGTTAECDHLVEDGLRITHAAFRSPGDDRQGAVFHENLVRIGDLPESSHDEWHRDSVEVEALAT